MDYFISHAWEDKQDFVKDLANYIIRNGATVFYDEYSLKLGDSLFESINKGIQESNNCIVIFSNFFFERKWTITELKAFFNRHLNGEIKILPIYHNITIEEVKKLYPALGDIIGIHSNIGFEKVAEKIFEATGHKSIVQYAKTNFDSLDIKKMVLILH